MTIAERIETESQFCDAVRRIREDLGLTHEDLEAAINLTDGHLGKIESGDKTWGKPVLRLTPTGMWLLEALGVSLMLVDTETARELTGRQSQLIKREHRKKDSREPLPVGRRMVMRVTRLPG